jgi:predicted dienelactone hydrolase
MNYLLKHMTGLETLELAQTSLWLDKLDLSPVAQTISYLNFKDVFQCCVEECPPSFYDLPALQHLDVGHLDEFLKWTVSDDLIDAVIAMPSLTSVDFSCTTIQRAQIERLISAKGSKLKFLGLFESSLDLGEDIYPDYLTVR